MTRSHQFLVFFTLLALFLLPQLAYAEDPYVECAPYQDIPVNVTPRFDQPNYDYVHSISAISELAADTHHVIHEALTLGLTRYEPMLEVRVPIKGVQLPDGLACAHAENVDITVGYRYVTVYVAGEIRQGTCGFEEVLAHEQKHIRANMQTLEEYTPRIKSEISAYLKQNGVFREPNFDYAAKLIQEKLQSITNNIMNEMTAENQQRQLDIDTVAEYDRISASCGGQLRGIASKFTYNER